MAVEQAHGGPGYIPTPPVTLVLTSRSTCRRSVSGRFCFFQKRSSLNHPALKVDPEEKTLGTQRRGKQNPQG